MKSIKTEGDKAEVIEIDYANVDLKIKCKCGEVFDEVDKDMNTWAFCPKCNRQYTIDFSYKITLKEIK